jgi:hypothetical protein
MSSSSAPTVVTVGNHSTADPASPPAAVRNEPSSPEQLEFARRVRSSRWQAFAPLLVTLLFGAALAFTAAAAPPTVTVQRMLNEEPTPQVLTAQSEGLDVSSGYELPSHWQWPGLGDATAVDPLVLCQSSETSTSC